MSIKIAIVEDNKDILEGLGMLINFEPGFECVSLINNGNEAIQLIPLLKPHVVLMDIDIPGTNGIECIKYIKEKAPYIQFIMLTVFEDEDKIFNSLKAGANGYLLKKSAPEKIISSIRELLDGGSPMNAQIARKVVGSFQQFEAKKVEFELTKREYELLGLISKGYIYKEIATQLNISVDTVRTHIRNIYEKLQVNSKIDAINKVFPRKNT